MKSTIERMIESYRSSIDSYQMPTPGHFKQANEWLTTRGLNDFFSGSRRVFVIPHRNNPKEPAMAYITDEIGKILASKALS